MQKLLGQYKYIFLIILTSLLVIIPLFPKFPFIKIPGTYVSIRFDDFILFLGSLAALPVIFKNLNEFWKNKLFRYLLLFISIGLLSLISAAFVTSSVDIKIAALHWARRIEYFVPLVFIWSYSKLEKYDLVSFTLKVVGIVTIILFLYGLGQRYLEFPVIITQNEEYSKGVALTWTPGSHINSTFAGHYDLATYMVMVLPIFVSLFFLVKDKWSKIMVGGVFLSGYWLLIESASRISLVSYLVGACIALLILKKYKVIPLFVVLSILLSMFSSNLFARYVRVFEVVKNKISMEVKASDVVLPQNQVETSPTAAPVEVFEDRSTSIRLNVEWPRALRAFSKNPILGTGYSSIGLATDNDYLRLLGELGILGILGALLVSTFILKGFWKVYIHIQDFDILSQGFLAGFIGGVAGFLTNAFFIDVFEASKIAITFWLFMGIFQTYLNNYEK